MARKYIPLGIAEYSCCYLNLAKSCLTHDGLGYDIDVESTNILEAHFLKTPTSENKLDLNHFFHV